MKKIVYALCASLFVALASCGGGGGSTAANNGGGVGSGGTGITGGSVGTVAGFGSIFVNGTRYDIDNATLTLGDDAALQLGMSVKVLGTLSTDRSSGVATSVESQAEAQGEVSGLNPAAGTFRVEGLDVSTDSETIYQGITALSQLANGDWVKLYGQAWGNGELRASRIEKVSASAARVLSGTVGSLNTTAKTFVLGNHTVSYALATFSGALTASTLQDGQVVRVRSSSAPVLGVLTASRIGLWYPLPTTESAPLSVAGIVTNFTSLSSTFKVLGYSVNASGAQLTGGTVAALGNGVKVEATGTLQNGVVVASKLALRQIPGTPGIARFTASGPVTNFVSAADFKVQGQSVNASGMAVTFSGGTVGQLSTRAVKVTVVGSQVLNGVLVADTVTFVP
jgi:hypothetical protein